MKRILAVMTINPDFVQFAIPQLKSVLSQLPIPFDILFKQQLTIVPKHSYQITHQTLRNFPFVTLNVPDFQTHKEFFEKACRETVMLNKFVLLISNGHNYEQLIKNKDEEIIKQKCRNWDDLVVCDFISRNRVQGRTYQIQRINKILGDLDIRGKIDLTEAKKRYKLIEDHNWYQQHHQSPVDSTLKNVYFGLQLCSNKIGTAKFNNMFQLSKRIYLGPTSADNDLAFMMCNQGKIQGGSFVLDPFVGTGGLIIPPASKGAYVFGCDLDMRVLNGYSVGRINKRSPYYSQEKKFQVFTPKIVLNFEQYGFSYPNIFRMDSTKLAFKNEQIFDAIITDPPYGLRAMSRSVGGGNKGEKEGTDKIQKSEQQNKEENTQNKVQVNQKSNKEQIVGQEKLLSNLNQLQGQKIQQKQKQSQQCQTKGAQKISTGQKQNAEDLLQQNISKQQSAIKEAKKSKNQIKKLNKRIKKSLLTQQQKQYKQNITEKLNRQRIDQWDKYDKTKVQCTQRQRIFQRLINFSKTRLKKGGRLVFLYPIYEGEEYKRVDSLPDHKGFEVVDMSENKLSKNNSRILVTLQKL